MARDHKPSRIFLVGFMGSGKTTLGRALAGRLGWPFVDLDEAVERAEGQAPGLVISTQGEPRFRAAEARALAGIVRDPGRAVIACGGGTFESPSNRRTLGDAGVTVWIDRPFERIWSLRERLDGDRPLLRALRDDEPGARALYQRRAESYRAADLRVVVEDLDPEAIDAAVDDLVRRLRDHLDGLSSGGEPVALPADSPAAWYLHRPMSELTKKSCKPCRGGVPTLTDAEIERLRPDVPGWEVRAVDGIKRLSREYAFPDFRSAMAFAVAVGELAEREAHHPDLHVAWGKVRVEVWTHKIKGLHENDFILAAKTDAIFAST